MPRDDWELDDGDYSPDRFYCQSTDGRGHGEEMRVKFPPALMGRLQAMFESARHPQYKTKADVVRDALYHWMRYREHHAGPLPDAYRLIHLRETAQQTKEAFSEAARTVQALGDAVSECLKAGGEQSARSLVAEAAASLPEHPEVRAYYLRELRTRFSQWLGED